MEVDMTFVANPAAVAQCSNSLSVEGGQGTCTKDPLGAEQAPAEIDEALYSRQLYVLGREAMSKMANSNVLLIGLKGLGIEIAKNIVLAGVKSLTIFDPNLVEIGDLSANFFLSTDHVGSVPRDQACLQPLAELNEYVKVDVLPPTSDLVSGGHVVSRFQTIVATEMPLYEQLRLNTLTHSKDIAFIAADIRGLFASVFCDFGKQFVVNDATGEPTISGMISAISHDADGVVTCLEETRHGLEEGDLVRFKEVQGMTELNESLPKPIKVLGPFTFSIGDTRNFSVYKCGGTFEQVKQSTTLSFKPLEESLKNPEYLVSDFSKLDRMSQLHIGFQALASFSSQATANRFPNPMDEADAEKVISIASSIAAKLKDPIELDLGLIKELSFQAQGYLAPMAAFIGGLVGQEVLKACSGKFHPIKQHFYFDALECLPTDPIYLQDRTPISCAPKQSRYDGQVAVFGEAFQQRIQGLATFVVGAGAIGCELLKVYGLMGLGIGNKGSLEKTSLLDVSSQPEKMAGIHLTDMDTIEKSNLNRQFLFRSWDVSKPKSSTAAAAVLKINPDLKGRIYPRVDRVGLETENVFDKEFFEQLDFVTNALDNVEARKYIDRRCVLAGRALLESGTLGTKGNTQVIIPHLTESYSSSSDPPEKTIPLCTLHSFPNAIEHTIEWALDFFHGNFRVEAENINRYLSNPQEWIASLGQPGQGNKERIESVIRGLLTDRPSSFSQCLTWARLKFEELFVNGPRQLLYTFPIDAVTSTGAPFWSGPKRAPNPITFDPSNELCIGFVINAANLRAQIYGLKGNNDLVAIKEYLSKIIVPEFVPKSGLKIQTNENEPASAANPMSSAEEISELIQVLPPPADFVGVRLAPIEFEKDDDSNGHVGFIAAAANLRAINYSISPADRFKVKGIAGKIIPAIATTTAVVAGLVGLEVYKLTDGCKKLDRYKNGFVNLALPFFGFSEPIAAPRLFYNGKGFTLWDKFEISNDLTLQGLIDYFNQEHKLTMTMLSHGSSLLFGFIRQKDVLAERLRMRISELIEAVGKKSIPKYQKYVLLEMMADDEEGNDVEVPVIQVRIK